MNELPNGWVETTLGENCTKIGSGSTPRGGNEAYKDEGMSLIRSQNILDFDFSYNGLAFIDDLQASKLKNVEVMEDDVLINITGDSVARVCKVPRKVLPARVNQHVSILRADNEKLNSDYLQYYLLNPIFKRYLLALANSGGTRKALTKNMLELLELSLPPLPEQKAIAAVLSAFDEKIELLREQNETLETIAQTVFKEWFVNFNYPGATGEMVDSELGEIPKGWRVGKLGEVAENISRRFNFKDKEKVVFINTGDVKDGKFLHRDYISSEGLPGQAKKAIVRGDILYSEIRPINKRFARVNFNSEDVVVSTKFMVIKGSEFIGENYLYFLLTASNTIAEFQILAESRSGTFPQITFDTISSLELYLPPINSKITKYFEDMTGVILYKISENDAQIQTLTKARDTLLPKLMSGKIRVKGFDQ